MTGAERLLAMLPGVRSASIEGDVDRVAEVRLLVEEDSPVSEILEAARAALNRDESEFPLGALFHVQVASSRDESPAPQPKTNGDTAVGSPAMGGNGSIGLITHQVRDLSPGVIGVELTLGLNGHHFTGGASGKAESPGKNLVPALATLSALGSYIRLASKDAGPTLALESVSEISLGDSRVAVVVVTMSGHDVPLIASWPLTGASVPAVVRATLGAAARRVTRSSTGGAPTEATDAADGTEPTEPTEAAEPTETTERAGPGEGTEPAERREPAGLTEPAELTEPAGVGGSGQVLRRQAESLLESTGPIASARIVLDDVQGFRIHVLATAEISESEVLRRVMAVLEKGLGLVVREDQITVAQSRLSREELNRVLRRAAPSTSAAASVVWSRPALADLHVVAKMGGRQEVGVRLVAGGRSFDGRREADGGGVALLRPLAEATLDAVGELMQRGGNQVVLAVKDVRRFKRRGDDGVVVLVEAMVNGRKMLSSGVAFSANSFERAAVVAVLQASNVFVGGVPEIEHDSVAPRDPSPGADSPQASPPPEPSGSTGPSGSQEPSDSPGPSGSQRPSGSPRRSAPKDYVSQVLLRMQSSIRRPGWRASGPPHPD